VIPWMSSPLSLLAVHGRHGARGRLRRHGQLDVDLAILDEVDARVEVHVDVRLVDVMP